MKLKEKIILILGLSIVFLITGFSFYKNFLPYLNKNVVKKQKIEEQINQLKKEIDKLKQFNEEEYAEKVSRALDFESYFSTSTDIQLEGVEIINKGDRKLVINHAEGYQIEIPKELILNQSKNTNALHFDDLELIKFGAPVRDWTIIYIWVWDKEKFPEEFEKFNKELKDTNIAKININGVVFVKKISSGEDINDPNAGFNYKTIKNNKIYEISIPSAKLYEDYVKTFKFINNE